MGISDDRNRVNYSGDGSSAVFNFPYEFHADEELAAIIYNSSRATVIVAQDLTTNYTLSGTKDLQGRYLSGVDVVFNSSPATGDEITLFRSSAINTSYSLGFNQAISRPDLVKAMDRIAMLSMRLNDQATRSIMLQDGFPYTFDPKLPAQLTKGAPIIVSSSGTKLELGITQNSSAFSGIFPPANGGLGQSLVPTVGQILYANDPASFDLAGPGASGHFLKSNGAAAPIYEQINLGSSAQMTGILPIGNGGSGIGTSFIQYGVVFASSATQMANTAQPGVDQPLVGNGGSAPTFQSINMASGSSVKNVLQVANGGTSHSSFVAASLIYGTSTSQMSFIANGGADQPLVGNIGGAPSYQALNVASNSSVTGIMNTANGGMGNSGYVQYGVIYAETATKLAHVPSAANGRVLTCHGSSAPTFDAVPADTPIAPVIVSSSHVVSTDDEMIVCHGSAAVLNLYMPNASGNEGRKFYFVREPDGPAVSIIGSSVDKIVFAGTSLLINADNDAISLMSDALKWQPHGSFNPSVHLFADTIAGQTVTDGAAIVYGDIITETHVGVYNSSSGVFTVPIDGRYLVQATAKTNSVSVSAGQIFQVNPRQTGSKTEAILGPPTLAQASVSIPMGAAVAGVLSMKRGDNLEIRFSENIGAATLAASAAENWLSITRIGN